MQAQDYLGALWAVGMRTRNAIESDVEKALAERSIVRCWPMRGTLHFVAAEDVRWMLELLSPRVFTRHRMRLERDFELDARVIRRARTLVERALRGGNALMRPELYTILEKARISTGASRGLHLLFALAHERVICFGARRGKQPTFVLFDEWVPASKPKPRDEALAEIARRYFASHGPATTEDFMWWTGLTKKEANEAIALAGVPTSATRASKRISAHLLPPFDEYTVAYKDRTSIIDPAFAKRLNGGGGLLNPVVIVNGVVVANWKRTLRGTSVDITITPFHELTARDTRAIEQAATRYRAFLSAQKI